MVKIDNIMTADYRRDREKYKDHKGNNAEKIIFLQKERRGKKGQHGVFTDCRNAE